MGHRGRKGTAPFVNSVIGQSRLKVKTKIEREKT